MSNKTIQLKYQNTPTSTSLACCSVTRQLNNSQRNSVAKVGRSPNTGLYPAEVNQQDKQPEQNRNVAVTNVFVVDANNKPLMPCRPQKARKLLKQGKAIVKSARPFFTIQLTTHCGGNTQPVALGVDTGYEYIGFALVGLYCYLMGQVKLDNQMSNRLAKRTMYRRSRRNRLRYRPARWLNRANQRNKDLPPSIQRRINRHIWLIEKLQSVIPVTSLHIESASFDIQKINTPDIQSIGYQQGVLFETNIKNYLFSRENGCCQYCGKKINSRVETV